MSKQLIKEAILANPNLDRVKFAKENNLSLRVVGAMYATLKRFGKIKENEKGVVVTPKKRGRKPKEEKNTYKNQNGFNKSIARQKMAEAIVKSGVNGIIPTLPNKDWTIERMINDKVQANSFLGVERDINTFKVMRLNLKRFRKSAKLSGAVHYGNISEVIYGKNEGSYAHLILDYCGNLVTVKREVEYSIQYNLLAVGGFMALTFAKPIRGIDSESLKLLDLAPIHNAANRCESDKAIEAYFQKITGFTHKVVEFFYYQDTYPMTLVLIQRVK